MQRGESRGRKERERERQSSNMNDECISVISFMTGVVMQRGENEE